MVGAEGITYVGHYGLAGSAPRGAEAIAQVKPLVRPVLAAFPCLSFEDKGLSFSLHYRNCDNPDTVRPRLMELMQRLALQTGGRVQEGKMVLELVPGDLPDKLSAINRLARVHGLRGVVYLGDDVSDLPVFQEIARRRTEERLPGLAIAVVDGETDDSVRAGADVLVEGVSAVDSLLADLAASLDSGAKS